MESHNTIDKETGFNYEEKTIDGCDLGDFIDITAQITESQPTGTESDSASQSESLADDNSVKDMLNELKRLTLVVEGVESSNQKMLDIQSSNQKMLDILVGLVKLNIKSSTPTGSNHCQSKTNIKDNVRVEPKEVTTCMGGPSQKRKTVDNMPILTGITTVILSDDDQTMNTQNIHFGSFDAVQMTENAPRSNKYKGKAPLVDELVHSNFKRSPHAKMSENGDTVAKKLTYTPSPSNISFKRQKKMSPLEAATAKSCVSSPGSTSTMVTRTRLPPKPFRPHQFKSSGAILPKYMKCSFRPTIDMRLTQDEAKVCGYVFRDDYQTNELVFSMGNAIFIRSEFQCLAPGGYVGRQIITMMAMKITWAQKRAVNQSVWCLPYSFANDVQMGFSAEKLEAIYAHDWMPAFRSLKLIYVPIVDEIGHWFLMVVAVEDRKLYLLDSHLVATKVDERHRLLKKIAGVLSLMVLSIYEAEVPFCLFPDFDFWDIVEPRGVPNCGHSENAGVWVCEWMNMQHFFNNQIVGVMEEKHIRMKIALRLLLGPHNDFKEMLEHEAKKHWEKCEAEREEELKMKN